jgi:formylglycine-generating enzyme required for sulfatase activity
MKFNKKICLIAFCLLAFKYPNPYRGNVPTSSQSGAWSNTTNLPYNKISTFQIFYYKGYPDSKVIGYNIPEDTVISDFFQQQMGTLGPPPGYHNNTGMQLYPGAVWVSDNKLLDEVEVSNINWQEFLFYLEKDSTKELATKMKPDPNVEPVEGYYDSPFFRFYPIVGITHEQAIKYCEWRSILANRAFQKAQSSGKIKSKNKLRLEYRLPTETEWETYAACGIDLKKYPYGVKYFQTEIEVNPKAAGYLKEKNDLSKTEKEIKGDIIAFNKSSKKVIMFNVHQPELPYFLQAKTPFYIFDLPINNYGLYNMIGNVSEMISEKGYAKGGSYKDTIDSCSISNRYKYENSSSYVGFRALCEIKTVQ